MRRSLLRSRHAYVHAPGTLTELDVTLSQLALSEVEGKGFVVDRSHRSHPLAHATTAWILRRAMAVISMFYGIIISLYFMDRDRHKQPHLHAKYQEHEAVLSVPDAKSSKANCRSTG